jgi:hypothetical protein
VASPDAAHAAGFPSQLPVLRAARRPAPALAIVVTLWSIIPMYVPSYVPVAHRVAEQLAPDRPPRAPAPRARDQRVHVPLRHRRLDEHRADAPLHEQVHQRLDVPHPRLDSVEIPWMPTTSKPNRRPK